MLPRRSQRLARRAINQEQQHQAPAHSEINNSEGDEEEGEEDDEGGEEDGLFFEDEQLDGESVERIGHLVFLRLLQQADDEEDEEDDSDFVAVEEEIEDLEGDENDDDDDELTWSNGPRPAKRQCQRRTNVKSGPIMSFDRIRVSNSRNGGIVSRLRGISLQHTHSSQSIVSEFIPNKCTQILDIYNSRAYSGQFSKDGSYFYTCNQEFEVNLYSVSTSATSKLTKRQVFHHMGGVWTITDCSLSSDNRFMISSSLRPNVSLYKVDECLLPDEGNINLSGINSTSNSLRLRNDGTRIYSVRFSGDNREIVAGASDGLIIVYDIERRISILDIEGHEDDVNAVCFANALHSQVLFTGSDDSYVKVWDRRALGASNAAVGTLVGHTEGITFISSKGDGRHLISNGTDQCCKLWDIRMMLSGQRLAQAVKIDLSKDWDYRGDFFPGKPPLHPFDCSILTMRGHSVLKTLIRCHFSPERFGGQRYVYTGSADGQIHIYDTLKDGEVVGESLSVQNALRSQGRAVFANRRIRSRSHYNPYYGGSAVTRDVSWHPYYPMLVATTWGGSDEDDDGGKIVAFEYRFPE